MLEENIPVEVPTHLHEAVKMVGGQDALMDIIVMHLVTYARAKKRAEMVKAAREQEREQGRGSTQGGHTI